jgi:alkanesulfonate monooxygenase SsuD/methylene tetrahydromethanopterin reductase-like flavin-dependent oxidoreductase (luciferase family)
MSSGQPGNGIAFGIHTWPPDVRQRMFDQKLGLLLRAWAHDPRGGPLAFQTDREQGMMPGRVMPYSYRAPHPLFAVSTNTPAKLTEAGRNGYLAHMGPFGLDQATERAAQYRQGLEEGGHDAEERLRWLFSTKWIYVSETDDEAYAEADRFWGGGRLLGMPWLTDRERFRGMSFKQIHQADPGPLGAGAGAPESPAAWSQRCHIVGSPQTVANELLRWERAGFRHIHARWVMDGAHLDLYRRSWRLFADEVMPRLTVDRMPPPSPDQIRPEFRPPAPAGPATASAALDGARLGERAPGLR